LDLKSARKCPYWTSGRTRPQSVTHPTFMAWSPSWHDNPSSLSSMSQMLGRNTKT